MPRVWILVFALAGCGTPGGKIKVDDTGGSTTEPVGVDADGDGWTVDGGDCDDADPAFNPGAVDFVDAGGRDENCDGVDGVDADRDSFASVPSGGDDCDDADASINPGAAEIWYDGVDQDCAGDDDFDQDGDGFQSSDHGGDDCDDTDPIAQPLDLDEDGFTGCDGDCDDSDPLVSPADGDLDGASGCDGDCDDTDPFLNLHDVDVDGSTTCDGDCDDLDPSVETLDVDGDGVDTCSDDCDDEDADRFPGAYDRPDDGVDQDCDQVDRTFDGVVLDRGGRETVDLTLSVQAAADVLLLIDTTCSMGETLDAMAALSDTLPAALADLGDLTLGVATYDDYNFGGFGGGLDKPFIVHQQQTTAADRAADALSGLGLHGGADGPESGMEALFQAFTGDGYDQNCNRSYDDEDDVRPSLASADDAFRGLVPGIWDPTVPGSGDRGGVGFRPGALPIVAIVTDNHLRDPDDGYDTPGGCAQDAGRFDVIDAAAELGGWVVGFAVNGDTAYDQLLDLAIATGAELDLGGDAGVEPLAFVTEPAELEGLIIDIAAGAMGVAGGPWAVVELVVVDDPLGLVDAITPAEHTDVRARDSLEFEVFLTGAFAPEPELRQVEVGLEMLADGVPVRSVIIRVELPPG